MPLQFLDPGLLRIPLILQTSRNISDGQGGMISSWHSIADLFAYVEPSNAVVRSKGRSDKIVITHRITIRYRDDIEPGQRFLRHGRIFFIRSLYDVDETKRYLVCRCEEMSS